MRTIGLDPLPDAAAQALNLGAVANSAGHTLTLQPSLRAQLAHRRRGSTVAWGADLAPCRRPLRVSADLAEGPCLTLSF